MSKIYIVQVGEGKKHLVEASSKKKAVAFLMPPVILAETARASEVAELMANGTKVEQAD